MKKTLTIMSVMLMATSAIAAVKDVSKTVHNLGSSAITSKFKGSIDQVCIYCHTPHNAAQNNNLLWNKGVPVGSTFKLYSSQMLSKNKYSVSLPAGSPSLLCLSCHDGKSAINVLHSSSLGTDKLDNMGKGFDTLVDMQTPYDSGGFWDGKNPANLGATDLNLRDGTNLTNDHPIGFSYTQVQGDQGESQLHASLPAEIRLFGPTNRMECSTCHDPHVNYNAGGDGNLRPFLVMSNVGSALCLACHNK